MRVNAERISLFIITAALVGIFSAVPSVAQDTIKIGAIYSLTGPVAEVAKLQKLALEMAVKEINDAGGVEVGGKKIKFEAVFGDDQTKAEIATKLFEDMVKNQKVSAVVAGTVAHVPLALNTAVKKDKALLIAANAPPDSYYEQKVKAPTALGMVVGAGDIGRAGAFYLAEKTKPKKVACFIPAYAYGNSLVAGFEPVIKKYPEITYQIFWHPLGSSNIKRDLEAVRDFRPDVIVVGSWGQDAVNAFNSAFEMGLGKNSKLFHLWTANSLASAIRPEAMKGVWVQMFWLHDLSGFKDEQVVKATNQFSSNYAKLYNEPPDTYAVASYDAVKEVARAIKLSQSTDPTKMYEALMANPDWTGAKGEAKWRKDGRCMYKYFDWIIEGKGPDERKDGTFGNKYDYARVVDVFTGDTFAPTLQELGY
ncbi:MAG: ABC transporter substrate-binding protein [Desulfomonilaceae bacterium]